MKNCFYKTRIKNLCKMNINANNFYEYFRIIYRKLGKKISLQAHHFDFRNIISEYSFILQYLKNGFAFYGLNVLGIQFLFIIYSFLFVFSNAHIRLSFPILHFNIRSQCLNVKSGNN